MRYYEFLQSDFTDPIVTGENKGRLSRPLLHFIRKFLRLKGGRGKMDRLKIVIQIHCIVKGASGSKFEITSKSFYGVKDRENVVVGDVCEMEKMALEVLRKLLKQMLGKERISRLRLEIPEFLDMPKKQFKELIDFVQQVQGRQE
jgi:hypothetical protein